MPDRRPVVVAMVLAAMGVALGTVAFVRFAPTGGWRLLALAGTLLGVAIGLVVGRRLARVPVSNQATSEANHVAAAEPSPSQPAPVPTHRAEQPTRASSFPELPRRPAPASSSRELSHKQASSEKLLETLTAEWMTGDAIVDAISDMLLVLSPEGTVLIANRAAARVLGRQNREEMMGIPVAALLGEPREEELHSDLIDMAMRHSGIKNWSKWTAHRLWSDIVRKGAVQNAEVEFRHRDGSSRPMMVNGSVMRGADGEIESVVIVARDERLAQRALVTGTHEAVARIVAVQQATGSQVSPTPLPAMGTLTGTGDPGPKPSFFGKGPTLSQRVGGALARVEALMSVPGLTLTQREQIDLVRTELVALITVAEELQRTAKAAGPRKLPRPDPRSPADSAPDDGSAKVSRVSLRQATQSRVAVKPPPIPVGADSSPDI